MEEVRKIRKEFHHPGFNKLWALVKKNNIKVTHKQVKEFYDSQELVQVNKPDVHKSKDEIPFVSPGVGIFWQGDLLDMSKYSNKNEGFKWILIIVDILIGKLMLEP